MKVEVILKTDELSLIKISDIDYTNSDRTQRKSLWNGMYFKNEKGYWYSFVPSYGHLSRIKGKERIEFLNNAL